MKTKGLSAWVHKLARIDMPALGTIISELNTLTGSDDADASQLAEVILKDPTFTSQVLRIANSVQYNPGGTPLTTVSRAIVLVGFGGIRDICMSVAIIDTLLGNTPKEHLLRVMAKGFHGGTQARWMTPEAFKDDREEVFVATMLQRLGEMAFWTYGGESADELAKAIDDNPDVPQSTLEQDILGVSLKAMSRGLCDLWSLGDVLKESLKASKEYSPKAQAVMLGAEISEIAEEDWDEERTNSMLNRVAKFTGTSVEQARSSMLKATEDAASVALKYGANQVCHFIAGPRPPPTTAQKMVADPQLQLSILRELANAANENLEINTVFQMTTEGMHRGIGLERVALLFILKGSVNAKYVLGEGTESWRQKFVFPVGEDYDNLFTHALAENRALLLEDPNLYGRAVRQLIGSQPVLIAPIQIKGRTVAFFYADRGHACSITTDLFDSFQHFAMQTQMTLQMLTQKAAPVSQVGQVGKVNKGGTAAQRR